MVTLSVIMSVYNEPVDWIRESLDSILQQSFHDFILYIVNDNPSRVDVDEILSIYQHMDSRVKVIKNKVNLGLTKSLNSIIKLCNSKYIARMDADDIADLKRFEKQVNYLECNNEIGVCGTAINYIGCKKGYHRFPLSHNDVFLFIETCFAHPSVMIRGDLLKRYMYNEEYKVSQDYELWTRLYENGIKFANLADPLVNYRVSGTQVSSMKSDLQYELSIILRRRALTAYCKEYGINLNIDFSNILYEDIVGLMSQLRLPKSINSILLYYLLLSINSNKELIKSICRFSTVKIIGKKQAIRLIYHRIFRHKLKKF